MNTPLNLLLTSWETLARQHFRGRGYIPVAEARVFIDGLLAACAVFLDEPTMDRLYAEAHHLLIEAQRKSGSTLH